MEGSSETGSGRGSGPEMCNVRVSHRVAPSLRPLPRLSASPSVRLTFFPLVSRPSSGSARLDKWGGSRVRAAGARSTSPPKNVARSQVKSVIFGLNDTNSFHLLSVAKYYLKPI